jgi:hypothetical protein
MLRSCLPVAVILFSCVGCSDDPVTARDSALPQDSQGSFLGACLNDSDCASGHCLTLGSEKRCSKPCSAILTCPELQGWSCSAQSLCECQPTGKQPEVCGVDGDCDGQPDKVVSAEICNGKDDDCNQVVDDVKPLTEGAKQYFKDGDGDGYGDDYTSHWLCQPESGWILTPGDCDDTYAGTHPGLPEVCVDLRDNDCDSKIDNSEICGLHPIVVDDVTGPEDSGTLKVCDQNSAIASALDLTEIVAKQDATRLKFTIRLAGNPSGADCASYTFQLGDPTAGGNSLVYIYRPTRSATCKSLPELEAYLNGAALSSTQVLGFLANSPGHISFILPKAEVYSYVPKPTYWVKACSNAVADSIKDRTACASDSCATPVRRD